MKALKITDTTAIQSELNRVQHSCSERLLTADEIIKIVRMVEERLIKMGVAKRNQVGVKFKYENGHKMPASYKDIAESTAFMFERKSKEWYVTKIVRAYCNHNRQTTIVNAEVIEPFLQILKTMYTQFLTQGE